MMRKILFFAIYACLPLASSGQTQQGFVKTEGYPRVLFCVIFSTVITMPCGTDNVFS